MTTVFPNYITNATVAGKADKVSSATENNFAGLDANGNLIDSGHKHSDYLTEHQSLANYVNKNGSNQTINSNGSSTQLTLACSTSNNNVSVRADSEGGNIQVKQGNNLAEFDSQPLVDAGTGYARIFVKTGTGAAKEFKFTQQGDFLNSNNVSMSFLDSNKADQNTIAIKQLGNTASQNIAKGKFVLWKGDLCVASAAIASGDTLSTSTNLTAVSDGLANLLYKAFVTEEYTYSYSGLADGGYLAISASDLGISAKAGYTLAGCVGYATGSYNIHAYGVIPRTDGTVLSLRNTSGTSVTTTVTCRVTYLWVKSELM